MSNDVNVLSEREQEILRLLATGASNKEIAHYLYISTNTVKVHLRNIYSKIGVSSRTEAAMRAVKDGLVSESLSTSLEIADNDNLSETSIIKISGNRIKALIGLMLFLVAAAIIFISVYIRNNTDPSRGVSGTVLNQGWISYKPIPTARTSYALVVYEDFFYAIGGKVGNSSSGVVERYNPISDSWEERSSKPTPVSEIGAAVIGGKVLVPGGRLSSNEVTDVLEIYDPRNDIWTRGAPTPIPISAYAFAVFEGRLYLFGGWDGDSFLNSVLIYEPDSDTWTSGSPMPTARGYAGAAISGRKIFVLGGFDGENALSTNDIFNPDLVETSSDPWQKGKPMPEGKYSMGIASVSDSIAVVGGKGSPGIRYPFMIYRVQNADYQFIDTIPRKTLISPGVVELNGGLFIIGGNDGERIVNENWFFKVIYNLSFPIITN